MTLIWKVGQIGLPTKNSMVNLSSQADDDMPAAVKLALEQRYVNGFRLGSFIEAGRLRKFVGEYIEAEVRLHHYGKHNLRMKENNRNEYIQF